MGPDHFRAAARAFVCVGLKWAVAGGATFAAIAVVNAKANPVALPAHWAIFDVAVDKANRPARPNVFGTVALPVRANPTSTRWLRIMTESLDQPALINLTAGAKYLAPQEQAAFVQSVVNLKVHDTDSAQGCAEDGYWAGAEETLNRRRGDCIDIAIAKMEALRLLGFPKRDLYLTTGYLSSNIASARKHKSAALLVRIDGQFWLLTQESQQIIDGGNSTEGSDRFLPVLTYGAGMTWVHGRRVEQS